jgi:hypothetical protein
MKKIFIITITAVLFVSAALVVAASMSKERPLKGSFKAVETAQSDQSDLSILHVTATGSGKATQLGQFTVSYRDDVNVETGAGTGSAEFVAANGDSLFAEGSGQAAFTETPGVVKVVLSYTITGGTGRFANASGTLTVERMASPATGETSGTMNGQIVLP